MIVGACGPLDDTVYSLDLLRTGDVVDVIVGDDVIRTRVGAVRRAAGKVVSIIDTEQRRVLAAAVRYAAGWPPGFYIDPSQLPRQRVPWTCPNLDELARLARHLPDSDERKRALGLIELIRAHNSALRAYTR